MSGVTDVRDRVKRTRDLRRTTVLVAVVGAVALAVNLAEGSAGGAAVAAVTIAVLLVLFTWQTRLIGTWQRVQELNQHAERLELAAQALVQARPCVHPDAEPVDLSTGERVAWVCPSCDAELPAGWTPPAPGTVLKPDRIVMTEPPEVKAAGHFAALARVGRESCLSPCPICAERAAGSSETMRQWIEDERWERHEP